MTPAELRAASFASYPASARLLAVEFLPVLRTMPLAVLPSFLVQVQGYPALFPVEAARLRAQLAALRAQPELLRPFTAIDLPPAMERLDWVSRPDVFVAALSGALWQSRQIDAYHQAAEALFRALPQGSQAGAAAPLLIAVLGRGAARDRYPLFTRLRDQGLYLPQLNEADAESALLSLLESRAVATRSDYAHWYLEGGAPWLVSQGVQQVSFPALAPVTDAVLREMDRAVREGAGPELLADRLRAMQPEALGLEQVTGDPRLRQFLLTLLTQGSGTQLYSTSFVQAAAVELVRRAQPQTLLVRFAPRRRAADLNDLLDQRAQSAALDAEGALVDADMAVYYAWLALRKQSEQARLVVWVEGHGKGFVAGPGVTRGAESMTAIHMGEALAMVRG